MQNIFNKLQKHLYLFFVLFFPFYTYSDSFQIGIGLKTAGFNNVFIQGTVDGNLSLFEDVRELVLSFNNGTQQFAFEGDGGFSSFAGYPTKYIEQVLKTFQLNALSYLNDGRAFGVPNASVIIGSFVSLADNTQLACSSFGYIDPSLNIPLGQYQLTLTGTGIRGDLVVSLQGTVTLSSSPP